MEDPTAELVDAIAQLKNATAKRHAARRSTPEHDDLVREEERLRKRVMTLADSQTRLSADAETIASRSGIGSGVGRLCSMARAVRR